jgi:hypothetical protein
MRIFDYPKFQGEDQDSLIKFVKQGLTLALKDIYSCLRALDFSNNFKTFTFTGIIDAAQQVTIDNPLNVVPSYRIIARAIPMAAGTVVIDDTTTAWTKTNVYLKNNGTAKAKVTVIFFE